jgi:hypothetical protein
MVFESLALYSQLHLLSTHMGCTELCYSCWSRFNWHESRSKRNHCRCRTFLRLFVDSFYFFLVSVFFGFVEAQQQTGPTSSWHAQVMLSGRGLPGLSPALQWVWTQNLFWDPSTEPSPLGYCGDFFASSAAEISHVSCCYDLLARSRDLELC